MIHVDRSRIRIPETLRIEGPPALEELLSFYAESAKSRAQRRPPIQMRILKARDVVRALIELFHAKCAYCETTLDFLMPSVEHFRPKQKAMQLNGQVAPDHYWWLTYEWENLYPVCQRCNMAKASRFPVTRTRAKPLARGEELKDEGALLLDPCLDMPMEHLVFMEDGLVVGRTERGSVTIDTLSLNRQDLVAARLEALRNTRQIIELLEHSGSDGISVGIRDFIREEFKKSQPYTAMRNQFISSWLRERGYDNIQDIADWLPIAHLDPQITDSSEQKKVETKFHARQQELESYSVESEHKSDKQGYYSALKRIERVEIENFKVLRELDIRIPEPQEGRESWLMMIGENGTGKSSVLQAIALALMGDEYCNKLDLDASRFVRREARSGKGFVKLHLTNLETPIELHFSKDSSRFETNYEKPKVLLLGYGSTRLLPRPQHDPAELSTHIRVQNLFDPFIPLSNAEKWLNDRKQVTKQKFDQIALALKDLLVLEDEDKFTRGRNGVRATVAGSQVTLEDLSSGYQAVVALVVDIMISLSDRWADPRMAEGIVLIDELEAHLHPRWKIEIVERLRTAFPHMQFIVTTHDPLCLRGLYEGEIISMQRDEENRIVAVTDIPPIEGLRADQLLTSPLLFGLDTTRGSSVDSMVARYSELFRKENKSEEEARELEELGDKLEGTFREGETVVQRQIEWAVQKTLSEMTPEDMIQVAYPGASVETAVPTGAYSPQASGILEANTPSPELSAEAKLELRRKLSELFSW